MARRAVTTLVILLLAAAAVLGIRTSARVTAAGTHHPTGRWAHAVADAERYARGRRGEVSFAAVDQRGLLRGYRRGAGYSMASTFKVMLLVAYLRRPAVRHRRLHRWEKGLLRPMIRVSDNVAATRVRDLVGRGPIERLARDAGMRDFRYAQVWGLSRSSAREMAVFMDELKRLAPRRHWRYAKHLLHAIAPSQRWGIGDVNTRGWRLFFKGGWGSGSGLVDHQGRAAEEGQAPGRAGGHDRQRPEPSLRQADVARRLAPAPRSAAALSRG